ncbi:MAG TPA: FAD-dependent oxidoreductase [Elusimicrobiales bacterium]|nr:FAD-dependent oxidoreductase [Elusimicrobiales bacterium]
MKNISINLDGNMVSAAPGATLLEIARAQGIEIPTLCADPRLPPYASCFVCIVEVQGRRGMVPACATRAEEGMVVRTNTENIRKLRKLGLELLLSNHHGDCVAPCNMVCPAGIDIRSYLSEAARGNFADALRIIKERNPFPSVCGRICPHPCEDHCRRKLVDEAVSINQVKRFISDRDRCAADAWKPELAPKNGKKIAVIGGGPGGMSAAHFLAVLGYSVTVFEAMEKTGGMLRYGVPDYRLPPLVLDAEAEQILALGVELRTGAVWGKDFHLDGLRKQGFSAIVVAIGAWSGQAMGVEGEDRAGVWSGIALLEKVNKGGTPDLGERVAVVGGGNTAIDCARTALRLGAKEVSMVYRRSRAEMPANPEEILEAEEEGVKMRFLTAPLSFSGSGKALSMRCVQMRLGEPDASGRRRPEPVPGSETDIVFDSVIAAIGQKVRWNGFDADGLKLTKRGTPDADPGTLRSASHPDVFVCGDCFTGPATAIEAIAGGRRAALSVHAQISGSPQELSPHPFNIRKGALKDLSPADYAQYPKMPRAKIPQLDAFSRARSCSEVSQTLAEREALEEARRCLLCGCQEVDTCQLRRYAGEYGAKGELYSGTKTAGTKMPRHPFIERDHQKCILCGRCVRVCAELQGSGAIGLAGRGFVTEVTSAWSSRLAEYACKSCGQCVAACPAGALSAKFKDVNVPAWRAGKASAVCPYCGNGCVLEFSTAEGRIQRLDNKLSGNPANAGICSRAFSGFDLLEIDDRLKAPMIKTNGAWRAAKWDEAMKAAAEGLKKVSGREAAVLGSPRLSNEALYLLQKIGRAALGTNNLGGPGVGGELDTAARAFGFNASTAALEDIGRADLIITALPGLEAAYPSVAAAIRAAAIKGAKVETLPETGGVYRLWLRAVAERTGATGVKGFTQLAAALKLQDGAVRPADAEAAGRMAAQLVAAERPLIVADAALLSGAGLAALADLLILAGKPGGLLLLRAYSNSQGAIDQGLDGRWLPGQRPVADKDARAALEKVWGCALPAWEGLSGPGIIELARAGGLKSLLSWGDTGLDGLDLKGAFAVAGEWAVPSALHPASVVFPAALFAEEAGSFTAFDRKVKQAAGWRPASAPQPNWTVLADLGKHLGLKGYEELAQLRREISLANSLYSGLGWETWKGGAHCAAWNKEPSAALLDPREEAPRLQAPPPQYLAGGDLPEKFIRARLAEVAFIAKIDTDKP